MEVNEVWNNIETPLTYIAWTTYILSFMEKEYTNIWL